jgi:hypothetical protein
MNAFPGERRIRLLGAQTWDDSGNVLVRYATNNRAR